MLMLSGIQHFMFCPRQWALIFIEQQWNDNKLTAEGNLLHVRVDDPYYRQKNGDVVTLRSVKIASTRLGLYGLTDVVELRPQADVVSAFRHPTYPGQYEVYPIEYKRGLPKIDERDEVQLCAEVICLEEMYNIRIDRAAMFYGETRHREEIIIGDRLRNLTVRLAEEMHLMFDSGIVPRPVMKPHCKNCSLVDICLPELSKCTSVSLYLEKNLYEETS